MTDAEKKASKAAASDKRKKEKDSYRTGGQVGYVFDNSELYVQDPNPGAPKGSVLPWEGSAANFDLLFGKIERTVKSATDGYVGASKKKDVGGVLSREIFVDENKSGKVRSALKFRKKSLQNGEYGYLAESSQFVQDKDYQYEGLRATRKIVGSENKRKLAEIAEQNAYKVKYSTDPGSRDYADIQYRFPRDLLNQYEQEHKAYKRAKLFRQPWAGNADAQYPAEKRAEREVLGDILDSSRKAEKQRLKEAEKRRAEKLAEENEKLGNKYTAKHKKYSSFVDENLSEDEKRARYGKIADDEKHRKEKEKKDKEEKAEEKEGNRVWKSFVIQGFAIVVAILDVCRRILSAAMDLAVQVHEDGRKGRAIGANLTEMRAYRSVEKARGLPEGTFSNFYQDIQAKFGDERHLDRAALEEIAPYLSSHIERLILSGNADADVVGNDLLNNLMRLVAEHKNWRGEDVGSAEEAFIGLYNSMKRAFPEGAEIFKSMYLVNQTGTDAGKASTVEDYITTGGVKTSLNASQLAALDETGQILQKMNVRLKTIFDDWLAQLAIDFRGVFDWIEDLDIGLDPEQRLEKHTRIYEDSVVIRDNLKKEQQGIEVALAGIAKQRGIDLTKDGYKDIHAVTTAAVKGFEPWKLRKQKQLMELLASPEARALLEAYAVNDKVYKLAQENVKKGEHGQMLKTKSITSQATQTARMEAVNERIKSVGTNGGSHYTVTTAYGTALNRSKDRARSGDQKGIFNRLVKNLWDETGYQFSYADIAELAEEYFPNRQFEYKLAETVEDILGLYAEEKKGADASLKAGIGGAEKAFNDIVDEVNKQRNEINKKRKAENKERKKENDKRKKENKKAKKEGREEQEMLEMLPMLDDLDFGWFKSKAEKAQILTDYLGNNEEIKLDPVFLRSVSGNRGAQYKHIALSQAELTQLAYVLRQRQADIGAQTALYTAAAAEGGIFDTAAGEIKAKLAERRLNLADVNLKTEAVAKNEQTIVFRAVLVDEDGNNPKEIWRREYDTKSSGLREGMPVEIPLVFENGG